MKKEKLPLITFSIVTLNEEKRIKACLSAIRDQKYPKNRMEIIIMDGGSTDKTIAIAKEFDVKVYFNEKRLAEPGLAEAYKKAKGDYMVFMAADNILFDKEWTRKMMQPFLDDPQHIWAAFSLVLNFTNDNIWNKYLNEDSDPFSTFVFGNGSHPSKFKKLYPIEKETSNYVIYSYNLYNFPLIALAQCTILKTGLKRDKVSENDDILPLIKIIEQKKKIAFVKNTGLYHVSIKNFSHFCDKFKQRIYNSIATNSYTSRENYTSFARKMRRYLFLLYSFSIIFPFIDGIRLMIQKKRVYMLLHPIVCFIMSFYILFNYIKIKIWRK